MNRHRARLEWPDGRVPSEWLAGVRAIMREKAAAHAALNLVTGSIYAAGGTAASPGLLLMQRVAPLWVWAGLWLTAGAVQAAAVAVDWRARGHIAGTLPYQVGHSIGLAVWLAWALAAIVTIPVSSATAGWALVAYAAANHVTAVRVRRKEARMSARARAVRGDRP